MIERVNPTEKTMYKTYLNWGQIYSLQNVAVLNWTERNEVHTRYTHARQPCSRPCCTRSRLVRVWCLKQEAWPTYWFHYLDSSPLFEPASSLAKQFNNTCQLLKCQGFVLRVNSLTGVTRTTYQLLWTSWQWGGCYRFSRDCFNHRKRWPGDREMTSLPAKEVILIPASANIKKHGAFWLLHWPFLLVASFLAYNKVLW